MGFEVENHAPGGTWRPALMAERDHHRRVDDIGKHGVFGVEGPAVYNKDALGTVTCSQRSSVGVSTSLLAGRNARNNNAHDSIVGLTGVTLALHPGALEAGQACDGLGVAFVAVIWSGTYWIFGSML